MGSMNKILRFSCLLVACLLRQTSALVACTYTTTFGGERQRACDDVCCEGEGLDFDQVCCFLRTPERNEGILIAAIVGSISILAIFFCTCWFCRERLRKFIRKSSSHYRKRRDAAHKVQYIKTIHPPLAYTMRHFYDNFAWSHPKEEDELSYQDKISISSTPAEFAIQRVTPYPETNPVPVLYTKETTPRSMVYPEANILLPTGVSSNAGPITHPDSIIPVAMTQPDSNVPGSLALAGFGNLVPVAFTDSTTPVPLVYSAICSPVPVAYSDSSNLVPLAYSVTPLPVAYSDSGKQVPLAFSGFVTPVPVSLSGTPVTARHSDSRKPGPLALPSFGTPVPEANAEFSYPVPQALSGFSTPVAEPHSEPSNAVPSPSSSYSTPVPVAYSASTDQVPPAISDFTTSVPVVYSDSSNPVPMTYLEISNPMSISYSNYPVP